ncbi:MAG: hypothetical protein QM642_05385, partial [Edaphocola sp.]
MGNQVPWCLGAIFIAQNHPVCSIKSQFKIGLSLKQVVEKDKAFEQLKIFWLNGQKMMLKIAVILMGISFEGN